MLGSLASANGKCGYSGLSESHLLEKWGSFSLGVDFAGCHLFVTVYLQLLVALFVDKQ